MSKKKKEEGKDGKVEQESGGVSLQDFLASLQGSGGATAMALGHFDLILSPDTAKKLDELVALIAEASAGEGMLHPSLALFAGTSHKPSDWIVSALVEWGLRQMPPVTKEMLLQVEDAAVTDSNIVGDDPSA